MSKKPASYSMASCIVDTATRLRAMPDGVPMRGGLTAAQMRKMGKALAAAEPIGVRKVDETERAADTQGICVRLGFRNVNVMAFVEKRKQLVAAELSETLGGFVSALQVECELLDDDAWRVADYDVPSKVLNARLQEYLDHHGDDPTVPRKYARHHDDRKSPEWRILARRIRYRLGIDHAEPEKTSPKVHWWTTPTTYGWMAEWQAEHGGAHTDPDPYAPRRHEFVNYLVCHAVDAEIGRRAHGGADWANRSPDDWGDVNLSAHPLRVLCVGPSSSKTVVHHDVDKVFARASSQLDLSTDHVSYSGELQKFTNKLRAIVAKQGKLKPAERVDVVLVYRGGGLDEGELKNADARADLAAACQELIALGIEVVVAMDHGQATILPAGALGLGVHEAITPTAGAAWILREHINMRLVDAMPDLGQHAI